jgi:soluble lytic murein transglycosylase-like protein
MLASQPSGWRALALTQVGRSDLAESQLRRLLSETPREMRMPALALAEKAGMPSLILQLSGVASHKNGKPLDAALYPVPPWEPASGYTVDRALIYAIMRHESLFDPAAVSSRGACGLMQIMPSTARHIANENKLERGVKSTCSERLFDPTTNVDMGQKYVRILSERPMIGDNLLFLLTAYNGGPGNLARWMAGTDRTDPLLFVESLPARETRAYVQQVLLHYWMYRSRLSQPDTAIAQLSQGQWPRYTLSNSSSTRADAGQPLEVLASIDPVGMIKTR